VDHWWKFFELLVTKWHDNYRMEGLREETIRVYGMFWPQWWLELVGYYPPDVLAQIKASETVSTFDQFSVNLKHLPVPSFMPVLLFISVFTLLTFSIGVYVGQKLQTRRDYSDV